MATCNNADWNSDIHMGTQLYSGGYGRSAQTLRPNSLLHMIVIDLSRSRYMVVGLHTSHFPTNNVYFRTLV
jgi:hypothetical protein